MYIPSLNYMLYGLTIRLIEYLITLFASLLPPSFLLLLIVIYDCANTYNETIIIDWYIVRREPYELEPTTTSSPSSFSLFYCC